MRPRGGGRKEGARQPLLNIFLKRLWTKQYELCQTRTLPLCAQAIVVETTQAIVVETALSFLALTNRIQGLPGCRDLRSSA